MPALAVVTVLYTCKALQFNFPRKFLSLLTSLWCMPVYGCAVILYVLSHSQQQYFLAVYV